MATSLVVALFPSCPKRLRPHPQTVWFDLSANAWLLPPASTFPESGTGATVCVEAEASLLGILWEAALGQPALASFLDQNWLEGLERSAATHFSDVFASLQRRGLSETALPLAGPTPP